MSHFLYLAGLLVAIGCLLLIDRFRRLAFWYDAARTFRTVLLAMAVFVVWDAAGIVAGIFFHPPSPFDLPFTLAPQFPLEEIGFLFLLNYVALLLYREFSRRWPRT